MAFASNSDIGLKIWASVPVLTIDGIVNIYLTSGFVYPVFRAGFNQAKELARSSCIAAAVALVTSFTNILVLSILHGHEVSSVEVAVSFQKAYTDVRCTVPGQLCLSELLCSRW